MVRRLNNNRHQIPSFLPSLRGNQRRPAAHQGIVTAVKLAAAAVFFSLAYEKFNNFLSSSADPIMMNYQGGITLPRVNFSALVQKEIEYGPLLTPVLQCILANKTVDNTATGIKRSGSIEIFKDPIKRYAAHTQIPPASLENYLEYVKWLSPQYSTPSTRFPENLSAFYYNGVVLAGNGNRGCEYTDDYKEIHKNCESLTDYLQKEIASDPTTRETVYNEETYRVAGYTLGISVSNGEPIHFRLGINPQQHANYFRAIKKIEAEWLQDPCFFEKSKEQIAAFIVEIHDIIVDKLPKKLNSDKDLSNQPGYRESQVMVNRKGLKLDKDPITIYKSLGATDEEIVTFLLSQIKKEGREHEDLKSYLSPEELRIWNKMVYVPPMYQHVPRLMLEFAAKLKEYMASDVHPVALAAWVHSQLANIQPFYSYNGKVARLFMNFFLQRGGFPTVYVPDDDNYSEAVNKEQENPGYFAYYLASLIKSQSKSKPAFSYGDTN